MALNWLSSSGKDDVPLTSRQMKAWVKRRSLVNLASTTKELFQMLQTIAKTEIDGHTRLDLMNQLRPLCITVLDYLSKQIATQSLPLPQKAQQIAKLMVAISGYLSDGYTLGIRTVLTQEEKLRPKELAPAFYWGMKFVQKSIYTAGRLYLSEPKNSWRSCYFLYSSAQQHQQDKTAHKDSSLTYGDKSTVENLFKQTCVFGLSRPLSLRFGEAMRLAAYLEKHTQDIILTTDLTPEAGNKLHLADLSSRRPPELIDAEDLDEAKTPLRISIKGLIKDLVQVKTGEENTRDAILDKGVLTPNLAARVLNSWNLTAKRRFKRVGKDGEIIAAISLKNIHDSIRLDVDSLSSDEFNAQHVEGTDSIQFDASTIRNLDTDAATGKGREILQTQSSDNVWDQISRGNVVTETSLKQQ